MKLRPLLPLALVLGCSGPARPSLPETIGFVDGEAVTVREYLAALELDERENEGLSPRSAEELRVARRALLDGLVDRKLLAQAARRRGIRVEEADVERAFLRLRADWPGESFDKLLADAQLTVSDLQARLRDRLIVEKLFAEEVVARVAITDADVDAYLAAHPPPPERPERVRAAQIVVKTEAEARRLQGELARGVSFAELARRYSLSPDAKLGGDLGWFGRGDMPPEFEAVCFTLPVGQVSDVVASPYGYHLFHLIDRRAAERPESETVRSTAEAQLRAEREAAAQDQYLAGLRAAAKITIDEAAFERLAGTR
jgi:peptidyl-prolyl cis-trans isomerase C/foldase protein PrsA